MRPSTARAGKPARTRPAIQVRRTATPPLVMPKGKIEFGQPWTISDPVAVSLLARPEYFRFLRPFLGHAASAAEVARELQVSLPRLRYWMMRALRAGVLVPVDARAQRGRSIQLYRTRSDVLYLPARATADGTLVSLITLWSGPWQERFVQHTARLFERAGVQGLRVARDEHGEVRGEFVASPEHASLNMNDARLPPAYGAWDLLFLDADAARQLQQELLALRERYVTRGGSTQYLLRLGLVPFPGPGVF